jgi:ribonuclease D
MDVSVHQNDLPDGLDLGPVIAVDSETMGLQPSRDRLCVVQLSNGDGTAHLVQLDRAVSSAPRLASQLADPARLKLFHFARFDLAVLKHRLDILATPVFCTKIASKLVRTYTDRHGLKDLCRELLSIDLVKTEQSSDWGAPQLSEAQQRYAAQDVLHLHALHERLETMLGREGRRELAQACFDFLPTRVALDLAGWADADIFAHS